MGERLRNTDTVEGCRFTSAGKLRFDYWCKRAKLNTVRLEFELDRAINFKLKARVDRCSIPARELRLILLNIEKISNTISLARVLLIKLNM